MSTPEFSVAYRAPGIVDVLIPKVQGRTGYRLKASPQFDGSPAFVQLFEMPPGRGFLDPDVDRRKLHTMPGGAQHLRATFNPDTFATGAPVEANIQDDRQFWMRFQPVDGGVAGADSAPVLVHPATQHGEGRVVIRGDAPSAATVAGSLTLHLGRRMSNMALINHHGSASLFLAFNPNGPEVEIPFGQRYESFAGVDGTIIVRGNGAAVTFSGFFTIATT